MRQIRLSKSMRVLSAPPPPDEAPRGGPPLWRFFALAHGVSWAFWVAAIAVTGTSASVWDGQGRWLVYLGGIGPPLAGVAMTYATGGREAVRELGARMVDPRRVPARWLAVALFLPAAVAAGALLLAPALGPPGTVWNTVRLHESLASPLGLLGFALFVLVFGPVPEEVGWRGYALDALQTRRSALAASLLLGAAWALWHLPLFFVPGYYGPGGTPDPVLFTTALLVNSVLYTWIYNHTARSVLAAIAFHFSINFAGMLVEGDPLLEWTRTGLSAAVAAAALAVSGARTLGRRGELGPA